jgi:hypothetical protein
VVELGAISSHHTAYKLTASQALQMLRSQGGVCGVCGTSRPAQAYGWRSPVWFIDHDHRCCDTPPTCGRCTRGLVCRACNLRLAYLDTGWRRHRLDARWIEKAIVYLIEYAGRAYDDVPAALEGAALT